MSKGIQPQTITEGHVKAVKDTGDFGGCNMWHLYVKDAKGYFVNVQWMNVGNIQPFFKARLPIYRQTESADYELTA